MKSITFVLNNFLVGGVEKLLSSLIKNINKEEFKIQVITILGQGPLRQEFINAGAEIIVLGPKQYPKNTFLKIIWLKISFLKLTAFLIKNKPDIVVTSLWQADILGIFSASIAGVKKRILIQHDVQPLNPLIKIIKKTLAINLSTHIVAISLVTKEFLKDYFSADEKNIFIINNGVDFKYLEDYKSKNAEIVFGSIARLEPVKGYIYTIEALKILKEQGFNPKILFYGDGVLAKELESKAKEYQLSNVQFLGEETDLKKMLSSIDVLLAPSLSEGFGLSVLEAMVAGKIVISSDLKAIREFIINDQSGILIEPKNSLALASMIKKVLEDKVYAEKIKKGLDLWLDGDGKRFDIKNIAFQYERLFRG